MNEFKGDTEAHWSDAPGAVHVPAEQWPTPDPTTAIDPAPNGPNAALPPPAPATSQNATRNGRFTPKRLAITFVVVLVGVVAGTLIANALTNSSSGNDQAMGSWMSSYGTTYLAVSHDTAAVNTSSNANALRAACVKLQSDVNTARSNPPMPISSLQRQWSAIVSNLSVAAEDCVKGIDQQSQSLLTTAQNHMDNAAQAYLRLARAVDQVQ